MSDDFADLEAAVRRLSQPSLADILRAQGDAEHTPPPATTMPSPDFLTGGIVRYRCPLACGWWHEENPGVEIPGPILLPADYTDDHIAEAISSAAEIRSKAYVLRVEQAIADHFTAAHPDR